MKTKDLKNRLKKESAAQTPDVLTKVRVSPINRLVKGEAPRKFFNAKVVTALLVMVLMIFAVLSVCFYAMSYPDDTPTYVTYSYAVIVKSASVLDDNDELITVTLSQTGVVISNLGILSAVYDLNTLKSIREVTSLATLKDYVDFDQDTQSVTLHILADDGNATNAYFSIVSAFPSTKGFYPDLNGDTARSMLDETLQSLNIATTPDENLQYTLLKLINTIA